jgi:hypothetical protein
MIEDNEKIWKVIFSYYLKWLEKSEAPMTINDLSTATGITRQTLTTILYKSKFKKPKPKTIVALANVWGEELYVSLEMKKPELNKSKVIRSWDKLPEHVRKQVESLIEPYTE